MANLDKIKELQQTVSVFTSETGFISAFYLPVPPGSGSMRSSIMLIRIRNTGIKPCITSIHYLLFSKMPYESETHCLCLFLMG